MVPALQAKLLRFLEEKAFKRVGGAQDVRVDVRVVAATNRNLEEEVAKGRFRSDLYYRLNVLPISIPPLRAHAEVVPLLVEYFIDTFNAEFRKRIVGSTPAGYTRSIRGVRHGTFVSCKTSSSTPMLLSDEQQLRGEGFRRADDDFCCLGRF